MIERLIERGHAYEVDGDVYFSVRSFPGYGKLSGRDIDELRVRRARRGRRAQARPARLRAVEVRQAGRAALAEPVGRGPPGLAPRVLGDVRGGARPAVRHPRRRRRPRLPAPRERDRAVRGGDRRAVRALLAARRHAAGQRREDEQVARQLHAAQGRARALSDAPVIRLLMLQTHYRSPLDFSDDAPRRDDARLRAAREPRAQPALGARRSPARGTGAPAEALQRPASRRRRRRARSSRPRWTTTSTPPARSPRSSSSRRPRTSSSPSTRSTCAPRTGSRCCDAEDTVVELLGVLGIEIADDADVLRTRPRSSTSRASSPATGRRPGRGGRRAARRARGRAHREELGARRRRARRADATRLHDRGHAAGRPRRLQVAG